MITIAPHSDAAEQLLPIVAVAVHVNGQRDNNCVRALAVGTRVGSGFPQHGTPVPVLGQHAGWIILPLSSLPPVGASVLIRVIAEGSRRVRIHG